MKKIARLLLLFSLTFVTLFLLASALGFLHTWIDAARTVPAREYARLADFIPAAEWALPFTLYVSILTSMSYAARKKIAAFAAFAALFIFAFGFAYSVSLGISHVKKMNAPPLVLRSETLGKPGLMLSGYGATMVLLDDPAVPTGERVVSLDGAGASLLFQETPVDAEGVPLPLPRIPFDIQNASVFNGLLVDFSLSAREFSRRFSAGFLTYAAFSGAVIFLLLSLAAVIGIGAWPLANVFLGAALFRLILSFEVFITGQEPAEYLASILGRWVDTAYITPLVFGLAGVLLAVYSLLAAAAGAGAGQKGEAKGHRNG